MERLSNKDPGHPSVVLLGANYEDRLSAPFSFLRNSNFCSSHNPACASGISLAGDSMPGAADTIDTVQDWALELVPCGGVES